MIQRGKCPFSQKVRFAQEHGAEAVVFGDQSEAEGGISGGHGLLTPWSPGELRFIASFASWRLTSSSGTACREYRRH